MTKYLRPALFATCTFCAIVAFCQTGEWKEYVYAEDGFAISSPLEPQMEKRTMKLIGGEVEAHFYYFPAPGLDMVVIYAPLLPNDKRAPEEALKGAKNGLDRSGATVLSEKAISLGKYPGTELEVEDSQYRQRGRFYAVERKIYTLVVSWPKGKPFPAEAQRWYDSFRVVGAGSSRPARLRVSQGVIAGLMIRHVDPVYPAEAKKKHIGGDVLLKILINKEGHVVDAVIVKGDPMLAGAAVDAVKQWLFQPYLLDGESIGVETTAVVSFGK